MQSECMAKVRHCSHGFMRAERDAVSVVAATAGGCCVAASGGPSGPGQAAAGEVALVTHCPIMHLPKPACRHHQGTWNNTDGAG
jgi:hypothetical protein